MLRPSAQHLQALAQCGDDLAPEGILRVAGHEDPDAPHPLALLRASCERPCGRRAAEEGDELAPLHHSITSSARASNVGGISRPSNLAAVRLMMSSNLVGCSTGMSP